MHSKGTPYLRLSWKRIRLQYGRPEFDPWVGKIPWRRERLPTPVFWPGEFHGLFGPWGCKERTGLSNFHFHTYIIIANCKETGETAQLSHTRGL